MSVHLTLLIIASLLAPLSVRADEVMLFAAASLTTALREIAPACEKATGHTLRFNFAASGTLARQIEVGAPADIFFSADQLRADQLDKADLLLTGTRRTLLANTLVLIVNRDTPVTIKTAADLATPAVRRLAIGEPRTVPAGTYAKRWLKSQKLWETVAPKIVPLDNVRTVLAAVTSGNADAGLVYKTDAAISENVTILMTFPRDSVLDITYPAAVLKESTHAMAAREVLAYLAGSEAQAVFLRLGFLSPE